MTIQQNSRRIQTTHIGSLPRPHALLDVMKRKYAGETIDTAAFEKTLRQFVIDCVARQVACGIDIVTDGEFSKPGFFTYVQERLEGFEARPAKKMILFQQGGRRISGILRRIFQARDDGRRHCAARACCLRRARQISRRKSG